MTNEILIAYVLLDLFLIVALARLLGSLLILFGQPRVVGEILAGILLGPTLLGENLSQLIAPLEVRPIIGILATLGLIMFMFLTGLEYDAGQVRGRARQAVLLAVLAVALPAVLGFPVAAAMYNPIYAGPASTSLLPFALLIGAALSVTAFPVMAAILMERGELNSPIGSLGVAAAAIMSVLMFSYIAFAAVVATASGAGELLAKTGYIVIFILLSWYVVRPLLARLLPPTFDGHDINGLGMAIALGGMVLYGMLGHLLGIHAMVGGFAWGLLWPATPGLRRAVAAKLRDVTMIMFLPVFFAAAGFSADLRLLTLETLPVIMIVLAAAVGSKFLAAAGARPFGLSWRDVAFLGALLNTRGLLVLVVGLIGLQLALITPLTFTITVIVALVTNIMTLPLLRRFAASTPAPFAAQSAAGSPIQPPSG